MKNLYTYSCCAVFILLSWQLNAQEMVIKTINEWPQNYTEYAAADYSDDSDFKSTYRAVAYHCVLETAYSVVEPISFNYYLEEFESMIEDVTTTSLVDNKVDQSSYFDYTNAQDSNPMKWTITHDKFFAETH